jgi:XTP/dITP diphosphohydrolase
MIFASNNKGKLKELKKIFGGLNIRTLAQAGIVIDVVEDTGTFFGNAFKKAREVYVLAKEATIADDSGLCIDAAGGWPGVDTRTFLGENATDKEINLAILERLKDIPLPQRSATARCILVYYDGKTVKLGEGRLEGKIATAPRGDNGFGFDEIFELADGRTLAELSLEEKNLISPRYKAAVVLKRELESAAEHSITYKSYIPDYAKSIIRLINIWIKERSTIGIKKETAKQLSKFPPEYFFVAFDGEKAIGFVKCEVETKSKIAAFPKGSTYLYIADVYVLPEYRHLGIGAKLVELAETAAKANRIKYAFLCSPATDHEASLCFYKRNDYNLFTMDFYKCFEEDGAK